MPRSCSPKRRLKVPSQPTTFTKRHCSRGESRSTLISKEYFLTSKGTWQRQQSLKMQKISSKLSKSDKWTTKRLPTEEELPSKHRQNWKLRVRAPLTRVLKAILPSLGAEEVKSRMLRNNRPSTMPPGNNGTENSSREKRTTIPSFAEPTSWKPKLNNLTCLRSHPRGLRNQVDSWAEETWWPRNQTHQLRVHLALVPLKRQNKLVPQPVLLDHLSLAENSQSQRIAKASHSGAISQLRFPLRLNRNPHNLKVLGLLRSLPPTKSHWKRKTRLASLSGTQASLLLCRKSLRRSQMKDFQGPTWKPLQKSEASTYNTLNS